ncbi:MAG: hypothetical protein R6U15_01840 [Candidatus Izemoplasmatales bacterium]
MNKMENRINSKIIKQLSLFLMLHGIKDFLLEFRSSNKNVYFIILADNVSQELLDKMQEKIERQREIEVETYGWELMDDTDSQNELDVLGLLIDSINIEKEKDKVKIILKRTYRYKDK